MSFEEVLEDHRSGSLAVTCNAAQHFKELLGGKFEAQEQFLREDLDRLVQAHSSMAAVLNLVNGILLAFETSGPKDAVKFIDTFVTALDRSVQRIGTTMAALIPPGCTLVTYSRSDTVLSVLKEVVRQSKTPRIMCSEARPSMEGQDFAKEMVTLGLRVEFYTDAGLISRLRSANLVLIGADALTAEGLLNKVGTTALLRTAEAAQVLRYVVVGTEKVLPPSLREHLKPKAQPTSEVWNAPPPGVAVRNPIFEWAPLSLVNGIVTEDGTVSPQDLVNRVAQVKRAQGFPVQQERKTAK
jgi:translation initiation factor eIF-2B subunit delta